jgi:hypothetical protein
MRTPTIQAAFLIKCAHARLREKNLCPLCHSRRYGARAWFIDRKHKKSHRPPRNAMLTTSGKAGLTAFFVD